MKERRERGVRIEDDHIVIDQPGPGGEGDCVYIGPEQVDALVTCLQEMKTAIERGRRGTVE